VGKAAESDTFVAMVAQYTGAIPCAPEVPVSWSPVFNNLVGLHG